MLAHHPAPPGHGAWLKRLRLAQLSPPAFGGILKGNRRITADTALRLSKYFGNSAKFWLGLQDDFDLEEEFSAKQKELSGIKKFVNNAA